MERLMSENGFHTINEKTDYNMGKVVYLQRKIKKYVKSNHSNNKTLKQSKHKNKINSIEDSENNLIVIYNSNYQNKLTSAKSQTFKNSSGNYHNESSHKEKYSKQSPVQKNHNNKSKHKSRKSSIKSEKLDSNNNNVYIKSCNLAIIYTIVKRKKSCKVTWQVSLSKIRTSQTDRY